MLESCFLDCQVSNCIPQSSLIISITPKWPLLEALIFRPVSKFDYKLLILRHELHLLYMHFRGYEIQGSFVSLCSSIIIPSLLQQTVMTLPHDDIHTCHSDYSKRNTYQIHHSVCLTSYVWEFRRKLNQKWWFLTCVTFL